MNLLIILIIFYLNIIFANNCSNFEHNINDVSIFAKFPEFPKAKEYDCNSDFEESSIESYKIELFKKFKNNKSYSCIIPAMRAQFLHETSKGTSVNFLKFNNASGIKLSGFTARNVTNQKCLCPGHIKDDDTKDEVFTKFKNLNDYFECYQIFLTSQKKTESANEIKRKVRDTVEVSNFFTILKQANCDICNSNKDEIIAFSKGYVDLLTKIGWATDPLYYEKVSGQQKDKEGNIVKGSKVTKIFTAYDEMFSLCTSSDNFLTGKENSPKNNIDCIASKNLTALKISCNNKLATDLTIIEAGSNFISAKIINNQAGLFEVSWKVPTDSKSQYKGQLCKGNTYAGNVPACI